MGFETASSMGERLAPLFLFIFVWWLAKRKFWKKAKYKTGMIVKEKEEEPTHNSN